MEQYDKIKTVGRGAFGIVHLCQSINDSQLVIIKEIPMDDLTTEDRISAKNEINVLKMLHHPNIIGYYDSFTAEKSLMIVMEYAPGGTVYDYLQHRLAQNMLLEEEEILKKFSQILLAIHHIHSQNILHRDLKTHNIFLSKNRKVLKIGDFGISKVMTKTNASTLVGSPYYLSPELCQNHPYNQKSDVWALGCILYELATLKRPFDADNISAIVCKIMRGQYAPISEHYSQELKVLIDSLLHLEPTRRPNVNKIMAQPVLINALLDLSTDIGRVPYKFVPKQTGGLSAALPPKKKRSGSIENSSNPPQSSATSSRSSSNSGIATQNSSTWDGGTIADMSTLSCQQSCSMVYFWGSGVKTPSLLPLPRGEQKISSVSVGRTLKLAVTSSGRVLSWENNLNSETLTSVDSQLNSIKGSESLLTPRFLEGLSGVTVTQVSCGDLFAAVLTDRGLLLTFGSGTHGCLGHDGYIDIAKPKIVEALLGCTLVRLSCGAAHIMVITDDGEIFSWGRGDSGRLGHGRTEPKLIPTKVSLDDLYRAEEVHCGSDCSLVLTNEKTVLACGNNKANKLGLWNHVKDGEAHHLLPITSPPLCNEQIKMIRTGTSHTAFLTDDGVLYTVGSNTFNQLGYQRDESLMPQKVLALEDKRIICVGCGDTFSAAVTDEGEVFTWGKGRRGRLGRGIEESSPVPGLVRFPNKDPVNIDSMAVSHGNTLLTSVSTFKNV